MNCRDAMPLLEQRPLGLLDPSQTAELDEHLTTCADCRAEAEALDLVHAELSTQGAPMSLPTSLRDRVVDAMDGVYTEDALAAKSKGLIVAEVDSEKVAAAGQKISLACSYCHDRTQRAELVFCASCLAPHHAECFSEHGRCSLLGCEELLTVRPGHAEDTPRRHRRRWRGGLIGIGVLALGLPVAAAAAFGVYRDNARAQNLHYLAEVEAAQEQRLSAEAERMRELAKQEFAEGMRKKEIQDQELASQAAQRAASHEVLGLGMQRVKRILYARKGSVKKESYSVSGKRVEVGLVVRGEVGTLALAELRADLEGDEELARLVVIGGLEEARVIPLEPHAYSATLTLDALPGAGPGEAVTLEIPFPTDVASSGPARVSVDWRDAPLDVVLAKLQEVADRKLLLRVDAEPLPTVTLALEGMPWDRALDLALRRVGCRVEARADGALLITQPPKVTVGFHNAKLASVIALLGAYSGKNVMLGAGVEGTCSVEFDRVPWNEALIAVVAANGLHIGAIGDVLLVTRDELPDDATPLRRDTQGWWVQKAERPDANGNLVPTLRSFDLEFEDAPLSAVLARIQAYAPVRLELHSGGDVRCTLALEQVTWDKALGTLCEIAGLWRDDHPDVVSLRPRQSNLLRASGVDLHTWFTVLAQRAGVNLVIPGRLQGRVSSNLSVVSYRDALVATAGALGLEVRRGRHDLYELGGTLTLEEGGPKPTAEQLVIDHLAVVRLEAVVLSPNGKLAILSGNRHEIGDELVDVEQLTRPNLRITAIDGQKVEITESGPGEPKVHFVKFR